MTIDLTKRTPQELKNLLENNRRHGQTEMVHAVLNEMARRGMAIRREHLGVKWDQDYVREIMQPFKEVAAGVKDNQRTSYTEAGGRKIGRPKDDPEWCWIDTYSAIKTDKINAVFVCYVDRIGADPKFEFHINGVVARSLNADQLSDALREWREIASRAGS